MRIHLVGRIVWAATESMVTFMYGAVLHHGKEIPKRIVEMKCLNLDQVV